MSVATEKAQRVKVVNAMRATGIAWSKQLWDCELACGHSQRVTGRSGGAPLTTTCDTCAGKPWTKRNKPAAEPELCVKTSELMRFEKNLSNWLKLDPVDAMHHRFRGILESQIITLQNCGVISQQEGVQLLTRIGNATCLEGEPVWQQRDSQRTL